MPDWFDVERTDDGVTLRLHSTTYDLTEEQAAELVGEVGSALSSMPPKVAAEFATDCNCCLECHPNPCAGVMAGGICDDSCWCEDDFDEDSWDDDTWDDEGDDA